jgi:hypothetical protein
MSGLESGLPPEGPQRPPIRPPEPDSDPALERLPASELQHVDARPGVLEAELERYTAGTERVRSGTRDTSARATAETENLREQGQAKVRHEDKRVDADVIDRESRTNAEIDDQARRTATEMNGVERYDRTTEVERYFWMAIAAVGVMAAVALAFVTASESALEYRLSPGTGLLVSGGAGLRLRSITRRPTAAGAAG